MQVSAGGRGPWRPVSGNYPEDGAAGPPVVRGASQTSTGIGRL